MNAAIHAIGNDSGQRGVVDGNGISVKLSALHPRYVWSQRERVMTELLPRLKVLCLLAKGYRHRPQHRCRRADRLDLSLDLLEALALDPELAGWEGIGFVVQAPEARALRARFHHRSGASQRTSHHGATGQGRLLGFRDQACPGRRPRRLSGVHRKLYTDVSILPAQESCSARADVDLPAVRDPQRPFARGGATTWRRARVPSRRLRVSVPAAWARRSTTRWWAKNHLDRPVRIYAPVGGHQTLLAYLVRRLLEMAPTPASLNRIVDETVAIDELIADPVALADALRERPSPHTLPRDIYGAGRLSSRGR